MLLQAQRDVAAAWNEKQVGRELRVLLDEYDAHERAYKGRTAWDCPDIDHSVLIRAQQESLRIGAFYQTKIIAAHDYDLIGTVPEMRSTSRVIKVGDRRMLPIHT